MTTATEDGTEWFIVSLTLLDESTATIALDMLEAAFSFLATFDASKS
jgi:hypothetical protein